MTTLKRPRVDTPSARVSFATSPTGTYAVVLAVFCGLLLISNVAATKTITVVDGLSPALGGGIFTDGGALLFPLTYLIGDVLAEVYGLRQARRAIWVGFALAALASLTFLAVGAAPPGPGYENQDAFLAVLGFVPRIVFASLCGYLAGQFLNAYVLVKIKERTRERSLWARLVGSTVVGEFADTALFCFIAFAGVFPTWGSLISFAVVGYLYKVAVEVLLLPVTYAVIALIKRREPGYAAAGVEPGTAAPVGPVPVEPVSVESVELVAGPAAAQRIVLRVDDVAGTVARLRAAGAEPIPAPVDGVPGRVDFWAPRGLVVGVEPTGPAPEGAEAG